MKERFEMTKEKDFTALHCEIIREIFNFSRRNEKTKAKDVMVHLKRLFPKASKRDFKISTAMIAENGKWDLKGYFGSLFSL